MKTRQRNEVLKLTREIDGTVMVSTQRGKNITLPSGAREATARYFESEEAEEAWIVGKFFVPEDLSIETQKKLCDTHVVHFTNLVARGKAGDRMVRIEECESYVEIWTRGRTALELGEAVSQQCAEEMQDAVWSGDADQLMTPEELEKFTKHMAELDDSEEA